MANQKQLEILEFGIDAWNKWRKDNPDEKIDLKGANLIERELVQGDFNNADLSRAKLFRADLFAASLSEANLNNAELIETNLRHASLKNVDLSYADLSDANLSAAQLNNANLIGANLQRANFSEADLRGADLRNCNVYGISAWDVKLENSTQTDLIIMRRGELGREDEPRITVDDLEVAQFINLMNNNKNIGKFINSITSRAVLLLGRFTEERKRVLDAIREKLSYLNYVPIVFDFDKPTSRDLTESVTLLARLASFIIVDLTDPRSIPHELASIIPELPSVPVQPIILSSQQEYGMYEHWKSYPWVLEIYKYETLESLLEDLTEKILAPPRMRIEEQKRNL